MSDNWIVIIPADPSFVPPTDRVKKATLHLKGLAPNANEITEETHESIQFFDCGSNLERIQCPLCNEEIQRDWWQEKMGQDFDGGFKLQRFKTPCCGKRSSLNDLIYDWPQGFARFAIQAMNPNIESLTDQDIKAFEDAIGTKIRVIYQHI